MAIGRTFQQAFAKAMRSRELDVAAPTLDGDLLERARDARRRPLRRDARGVPRAARPSDGGPRAHRDRPVVPARAAGAGARPRGAVRAACARSRRSTPAPPSSRPRRRTTTRPGSAPPARTRSRRGDQPSVMILGSGPNRIGQGIEFDYCCVHAAMTVRESGRDAVMVNCNPETVSTDYDTSDRLYFEPLTLEDVLGDRRGRAARGRDRPVRRPDAAQARRRAGGGRRAAARHPAGGDRPGRGPRALRRAARPARAARRRRTRPRTRAEEALAAAPARRLPAARAPELRARRPRDGDRLLDSTGSRTTCARRARRARRREIFLDRFLENAIEVDVDAICDGEDVWIGGIMQHVEEAGIHSGDSACVLPPHSLGARDARRDPRGHARHRARARRRRADQRPVRRARRRPLRDRGQPARVADGAVRLQGDRAAAGQARLPGDARREARRRSTCRTTRAATTSRSRRRCCRSTASPAPTRCSARRCARPAR